MVGEVEDVAGFGFFFQTFLLVAICRQVSIRGAVEPVPGGYCDDAVLYEVGGSISQYAESRIREVWHVYHDRRCKWEN